MNAKEFIRRMRKGLPVDRVLKSCDEFREFCVSLEGDARHVHILNDTLKERERLIETLTDVIEEQHNLILGYMEADKQRGLDSGKIYSEHVKRRE